jgi:hypothetical protein
MNYIINLLNKYGILESDLDYHLGACIDGAHIFIFSVSKVVGLRGAGADSLYQQRSSHFLDVPCLWRPGSHLVPWGFGMVVRRAVVLGILE